MKTTTNKVIDFSIFDSHINDIHNNNNKSTIIKLQLSHIGLTHYHNALSKTNSDISQKFHFRVKELIQVMSMKTTVKTVSIERDFLSLLNEKEFSKIFEVIGTLPNLEHIEIKNHWMDFSIEILTKLLQVQSTGPNNRSMKRISLVSCNFTGSDHEFDRFFSALKCSSLKELEFRFVSFPPIRDGNKFVEALSQLRKLELVHVKIDSFLMNTSNAMQLSTTILEEITLLDNYFGHDVGNALASLVNGQKKLKNLYLQGNNMKDEIIEKILISLQLNISLNDLHLVSCNLGNHSADAIAGLLKCHNSNLKLLDLRGNKSIDDQSWKKIAHSLQYNSALKEFDISCCNIGDIVCSYLASAFKQNTTLEIFSMKNNRNISNAGYKALCNAMEYNFVLQSINLHCNGQKRMNPEYKLKINFFLILNKEGNRKEYLLSNATTKDQYINNIIQSKGHCSTPSGIDSSILYYLIRSNPSIIL